MNNNKQGDEESWLSRLLNRKKDRRKPIVDESWPDWYLEYYHAFEEINEEMPYPSLNFTVFDTETTGLNPKVDRLLSIGGLRITADRLRPADVFSKYLNPEFARDQSEAVVIHGLVPDSAKRTYLEEEEVLKEFLQYIGSSILVAHHMNYDREMVNLALARAGAGKLLNRCIDTVQVARRLSPAGYWSPNDAYSLDLLARRHNIPLSDRHTALGDSYITGILLMKLVAKLRARRGRELQLDDLM